ncbi:unnamed protein product [Caenorhabditis angaria]|uniref:Uncharacterized protein n=1 Tax=Caenorhabditis angaria TaxID=860376 RepID=A0A9P1IJS4_9PELO|nr:unnamed protein product [Caenorhabditis angaria]
MHITRFSFRNLNVRHWNRKLWEVGYRGPVLPQQKATGRPDYPISPDRVNTLRERLARENVVMNLLTKPYTTQDAEVTFLATKGVNSLEELRNVEFAENEARRMPGKEKRTDGSKAVIRRRGNIGNLLHTHSTVEDSLAALANRKRWD